MINYLHEHAKKKAKCHNMQVAETQTHLKFYMIKVGLGGFQNLNHWDTFVGNKIECYVYVIPQESNWKGSRSLGEPPPH